MIQSSNEEKNKIEGLSQDSVDVPKREPYSSSDHQPQYNHSYSVGGSSQPGSRAENIAPVHMHTPSSAHENHENIAQSRAPEANRGYQQPRSPRQSKGYAGRIFRAICLIIVCAAASAFAAYSVIEYRYSRGDFDISDQLENFTIVEIGGTRSPEVETLTTSETPQPAGMLPEDIYAMALTQVVGIRTDVPTVGWPGEEDATTPLSGSGFVITSVGHILTNYHVIEVAHENDLPIVVTFNGGREHKAEVVGFDSLNDVALLKIDATGLNPVFIGNSDNISVGQRIYAIGNPFGDLVHTMTDGIVSALDRVVTVDRNIINAFQLSAAVNSGNSGGPVYNTDGEVIGIVTAKMMRGSVEGIGFAIPINDAIQIASELIAYGYIPGRAFLGVTTQTVRSGAGDTERVSGSLIMTVTPGAAADKAGVQVGDIIIQVDNIEINSLESLRFALRNFNAGDTTTIVVWRAGERIPLSVTFEEDVYAGRPDRQ